MLSKKWIMSATLLALVCTFAMIATVGGATSASAQVNSGVHVPRAQGKRLDIAEAMLKLKGLRYKEHGGGILGIIVKHNWQVCLQAPSAGKIVRKGTRVQLYVSRPGEC